ncbi:sigma-54-dependent Fis family transcriptional regulator [Steroidobacter agaridevorans]|uniref:Sigma-54-dependent Fis family transcriptional regulator n=1 Tax=Steroidobacter agaridevorans TaxID=2695856 RepID=A0A829YKE8_9GAMM|nr:sigma-54 dependent transcriptional regulator [Steroidobacter agaridevorans]GFE83837.1 sigma-54-dependent Fis family transcriptional regulator [Steroidobacter agaridevorans]GFE91575.1 sigma-54-dependent Fis family transcriptional regulator [Steroidobacter agaridevorans]
MTTTARPVVLVLDDEKNICKAIELALGQEGMDVVTALDVSSALRTLHGRIVDAVIVDIRLGEIDGLSFFKRMQADGITAPAIFISGNATLTEAAQAVKIGGYDFLEKPFSSEKLITTVRRCLDMSKLRTQLALIESQSSSGEIVGQSGAIRKLVVDIARVAKSNANVLITGESGVGKELVANSIHAHSERAEQAFVKVNCSAIPDSLIESELFGHERGAFTGATASKKGLFEVAHRGVIFLDEIADLSVSAQAKILRVLQNGEIQKIGSETVTKVDVRVVSGTHKDLKKEVTEQRFREDLFYRLNVVPMRVPALRERIEDLPELIAVLMRQLSKKNNLKEKPIDEEVVAELQRYAWPGNVRELQNVLERMSVMSGERITVLDVPEEILSATDGVEERHDSSALRTFRDRSERDFIIATLKRNKGNISQSASDLGVRRTYLHKRLSVLKIGKKEYFL